MADILVGKLNQREELIGVTPRLGKLLHEVFLNRRPMVKVEFNNNVSDYVVAKMFKKDDNLYFDIEDLNIAVDEASKLQYCFSLGIIHEH